MLLNILLTGAAGLIGGEIAARLVTRGHRVTALVHRERNIRANDGSAVAAAQVVQGDVSSPRLGIDEATYAHLAETHDLLIHCAATTRFNLPEREHFLVNTAGTAQAVALARAGGMTLLHVSTAYVCGSRDGRIGEDDPLPQWGFTNAYEASKAAAERLVSQSGLHHAIARPSIVLGDSHTGAIRTFHSIYGLFKLIAHGRLRHLCARSDATLAIVPIDHVAAGIVAIAERMEAASGAYHLASRATVSLRQCFAELAAYPGLAAPVLIQPGMPGPSSVPVAARSLYDRTAAFYESYLDRSVDFDDARFLDLTGLACPDTGPAYLRRLIDFCADRGFVRTRASADVQAVT